MKTVLRLKYEFTASHSLEGYEEPHSHLWRIEAELTGLPQSGKIIDLVELRTAWDLEVQKLSSTYLNNNEVLDLDSRRAPTCETLGSYLFHAFGQVLESQFLSRNSSLRMVSVVVALCGTDDMEMGAARVSES